MRTMPKKLVDDILEKRWSGVRWQETLGRFQYCLWAALVCGARAVREVASGKSQVAEGQGLEASGEAGMENGFPRNEDSRGNRRKGG